VKAIALDAGIVELRRQRESLGHVRIRAMERRVEARDLGKLRRAFEQSGHRRQVVGLMERRQRDEALESLDRLGLDSHRRHELQAPVDDPVPYPPEPPTCQEVLQELAEIFDRPVMTKGRSRPRLFSDDTSGGVARCEARRHVQALDLASELQGEVVLIFGEDGELDARGAGVQNEDRVIRLGHRHPVSSQLPYLARRGRAGRPKWPRGKAGAARRGC
jgi:hypothetical protein